MYTTIKSSGQLQFGLDLMSDLYKGTKYICGEFKSLNGEGTLSVSLGSEQEPKCIITCTYTNGAIEKYETSKSKKNIHYVYYKHLLNSIKNTLNKNGIHTCEFRIMGV